MLFKAMKNRGSAQGQFAIKYCLDLERHKGAEPRILKGDKNLTELLIKSNPYKEKAFFGVLSFEEKVDDPRLTESKKQEIMERFEKALFGEYMREHLNTLWVEHTDKNGRLELNIIVPSINITTQKQFTPNVNKRDFRRTDTFCELINIENDFSSPFDPAKKNNVKGKNKVILSANGVENYREMKQLDALLQQLANEGKFSNRDELIYLMKSNLPQVKIGKIADNYIEFKLPQLKRFRKLEGGIYAKTFTNSKELLRTMEQGRSSAETYAQTRNRETATKLTERLQKSIRAYDEYNARKFGSSIERANQATAERDRKVEMATKLNSERNNEAEQRTSVENRGEVQPNNQSSNISLNISSNGDLNNSGNDMGLQEISRANNNTQSSVVYNSNADSGSGLLHLDIQTIRPTIETEYYKRQNERKKRDDEHRENFYKRYDTARRNAERARKQIEWSRERLREQEQRLIELSSRVAKARGFIDTIRTAILCYSLYRERKAELDGKLRLLDKMVRDIPRFATEHKRTAEQERDKITKLREQYKGLRERISETDTNARQFEKQCDNKERGDKVRGLFKEFTRQFGKVCERFKSVRKSVVEILDKRKNEQNLEVEQEPISRFKL